MCTQLRICVQGATPLIAENVSIWWRHHGIFVLGIWFYLRTINTPLTIRSVNIWCIYMFVSTSLQKYNGMNLINSVSNIYIHTHIYIYIYIYILYIYIYIHTILILHCVMRLLQMYKTYHATRGPILPHNSILSIYISLTNQATVMYISSQLLIYVPFSPHNTNSHFMMTWSA